MLPMPTGVPTMSRTWRRRWRSPITWTRWWTSARWRGHPGPGVHRVLHQRPFEDLAEAAEVLGNGRSLRRSALS